MKNHRKIEQIVKGIIEQKLNDVEITSVNIRPDIDEDGDEILVVNVVFGSRAKNLDAKKASGLARHIIPVMQKIGEVRFPILTFISKSELGEESPEAA